MLQPPYHRTKPGTVRVADMPIKLFVQTKDALKEYSSLVVPRIGECIYVGEELLEVVQVWHGVSEPELDDQGVEIIDEVLIHVENT